MLTKDLENVILNTLFGNPFVMDKEAEDMTQWIAEEVIPNRTTWAEFEEIAYRSFENLDWLDSEYSIGSIWVGMHHNPFGQFGLLNVPKEYPEVHKIKDRVGTYKVRKVA